MTDDRFRIEARGKSMTASFADNTSAEAFRALLAEAPLTVEMTDYGNFEKVGDLGHSLPTNDTRITTAPGDVILYLGNHITIYYDRNTWSFTRLGKIDGNPTRESVLSFLGSGSVSVTFSLAGAPAGVEATATDNLDVEVSGLTVKVAGSRDTLTVYSSDGKCVYRGNDSSVTLPCAGLYMLTCGNAAAKVLVR